jgi:hypothetical protein
MVEKLKQNKWWVRLTSETPDDFKFLRKVASMIGTPAMGIVSLSATITFPGWLVIASTVVFVICLSVAGTASFAKKG